MKNLITLLLVLFILILESCSLTQKHNYPPELEIILNEFDKCSKENILNNWGIAKFDKQKDYQNIYFFEELNNNEIDKALSILNFKTMQVR